MLTNLRKVTSSDIPLLIALEGMAGTKTYSPMLKQDEWEEEIKNNFVFLIEKDGIVVGNFSYEKKSEDHIYISGLIVIPEFQGQGIAREVMNNILEQFKEIKRIDLVTHPDNVIALKLYQSLGFEVESRKENYFDDGEPRLMLVLKK